MFGVFSLSLVAPFQTLSLSCSWLYVWLCVIVFVCGWACVRDCVWVFVHVRFGAWVCGCVGVFFLRFSVCMIVEECE